MVSDTLEQRIYELVRSHDGIYLFKNKELTPTTDLDSDLRLEDDEALALMDDFFTTCLWIEIIFRSLHTIRQNRHLKIYSIRFVNVIFLRCQITR